MGLGEVSPFEPQSNHKRMDIPRDRRCGFAAIVALSKLYILYGTRSQYLSKAHFEST